MGLEADFGDHTARSQIRCNLGGSREDTRLMRPNVAGRRA